MQLCHSPQQIKELIIALRKDGARLAFVPTMGNLHPGHLALVKHARQSCDRVVVSIFVNPLQFGANEDLDAYPRTLEQDRLTLERLGVDGLFLPTEEQMYPDGKLASTRVEVPGLSDILCGAGRPGHFLGVTTIVTKLFNIIRPDVAVFGEKDYQQLNLIKRMVSDLFMDIDVQSLATIREDDGLAMSSRNGYLSAEQRVLAPTIYKVLKKIEKKLLEGAENFQVLSIDAEKELLLSGFEPEYVEIRNAKNLQPIDNKDEKSLVVLIAARLGTTRLIDNLLVRLK